MKPLAEIVSWVRSSLQVRRYHQYFVHKEDTIASHSCGVALFIHMIDPDARKEVLLAALTHDLGESLTGDVPSPFKRMLSREAAKEIDVLEKNTLTAHGLNYPERLSPAEYKLLKFADCFDGLAFCLEEKRRGNSTLQAVGDKYVSYLSDRLSDAETELWFGRAQQIFTSLYRHWSKS